jgi:hypothetical protein
MRLSVELSGFVVTLFSDCDVTSRRKNCQKLKVESRQRQLHRFSFFVAGPAIARRVTGTPAHSTHFCFD